MRVLNYALVPDGGTQVLNLELDSGERVSIGLDGRMGTPREARQLFIGGGPEAPGTRLLPIGGEEERATIALLERWRECALSPARREFLTQADDAGLQGQDLLDRMALEFLADVQARAQA